MYLNEGFKSNVFKSFILIKKRVTIGSNNFNTQDKILSISDIPRNSDLPDSNQVYSIDYFVHLNLVYLITGFS